jgi:hypothetical protein
MSSKYFRSFHGRCHTTVRTNGSSARTSGSDALPGMMRVRYAMRHQFKISLFSPYVSQALSVSSFRLIRDASKYLYVDKTRRSGYPNDMIVCPHSPLASCPFQAFLPITTVAQDNTTDKCDKEAGNLSRVPASP